MMQKERFYLLDMLKGLALLGVVFYHANLFTYGYLGVDIFLVVAGYFTTRSIITQYDNGSFSYLEFLERRLVRLWPLVIIISMLSLGLGYFTMFPTNYKNTAETALGSSIFLNNFVQYITAGNYWDASNEYKPLMHTWYIGLALQFYVLYPLFFMVAHRFSKNWKQFIIKMLVIVGLLSLLLYALPIFTPAFHFYLLPSRLFEFIAGGLIATSSTIERKENNWKVWGCLLLVILLIAFNANLNAQQYRLLAIVLTTTLLIQITTAKMSFCPIPNIKVVSFLGMASYSIYLWHQVIIAFYRNIIENQLSVWDYLFVIGGALTVGYFSYYFIEQGVEKAMKRNVKTTKYVLSICCVLILPISYLSINFYKHEGVVRDIPELETYISKPTTWATLVYNDTIDKKDIDFPSNDKKNVLIVGDSYARDWYNILKESNYADSLNLSYHKALDNVLYERIRKANYIFLANNGDFNKFGSFIPQMSKKKLYRVGDKRFFSSPCLIYNKRFFGNSYYDQKIDIANDIVTRNINEKRTFGDGFINMMDVVRDSSGQYNIFTPEHKLISHDGLHLTRAGARFYASKLNISKLFMVESK